MEKDSLFSTQVALRYKPKEGHELDFFTDKWCSNCSRYVSEEEWAAGEADFWGCRLDIDVKSALTDIRSLDYPPEWRINSDGVPVCSSFVDLE